MNAMNTLHSKADVDATQDEAPCCGPTCCDDTALADVQEDAPSVAPADVKTTVREKYAAIAASTSEDCGCGPTCCSDLEVSMIGDEYDGIDGYVAEADLGLGCGLPTEVANLREGDVVLDLGAGAGLDAFVARSIVGEAGQVIGVDMTPEMVEKARQNVQRLGYENVSFLLGEIEALPLEREAVDVVISNCVLNLVPDKDQAFREMHRVLRPGGHFCVSDVVATGALPLALRRSAELYAGCVAGVIEQEAYLAKLREAGFVDVRIVREKPINLPDEVLLDVLSPEDVARFRQSGAALRSVTVYGERDA